MPAFAERPPRPSTAWIVLVLISIWPATGGWAQAPLLAQLAPGDSAPAPPPSAAPDPAALAAEATSPRPPQAPSGNSGLSAEVQRVLSKPVPEGLDDLRIIQQRVQHVLKSAVPATVGIELGEWSGSGVVVSADGLVLTAGHVVGRPDDRAEFHFHNGKQATGRMLGSNRELDCGMMQITDPDGPWPFVEPAPADTLRPGDWVIATGQPGGYQAGRSPPVRLGRVLCLDDNAISTDSTLVGGDSGGPLLDLRGRLVGIHSRIGELVTSNLHVPIAAYHEDWYRLLAGEMWGGQLDTVGPVGDQPLFGLAGADIDQASQPGCRVTQVFPDHPAALAGIRSGDILTRFDRQAVRSIARLGELLMAKKPGDRVSVEIRRGNRRLSLEVLLGRLRRPFPGGRR